MKRALLLIATVVVTLIGIQVATAEIASAFHQLTNQNIQWIGSPMVGRPDNYSMNESCFVDVEIGLRDDGVIVWRKARGVH
jgi:hypothetical protein